MSRAEQGAQVGQEEEKGQGGRQGGRRRRGAARAFKCAEPREPLYGRVTILAIHYLDNLLYLQTVAREFGGYLHVA